MLFTIVQEIFKRRSQRFEVTTGTFYTTTVPSLNGSVVCGENLSTFISNYFENDIPLTNFTPTTKEQMTLRWTIIFLL